MEKVKMYFCQNGATKHEKKDKMSMKAKFWTNKERVRQTKKKLVYNSYMIFCTVYEAELLSFRSRF